MPGYHQFCPVSNVHRFPDRKVVVRFEFSDDPKGRRFWLILDRPQVDFCLRDEGFEVDLDVQIVRSKPFFALAGERSGHR
jgi:hypothetical protein